MSILTLAEAQRVMRRLGTERQRATEQVDAERAVHGTASMAAIARLVTARRLIARYKPTMLAAARQCIHSRLLRGRIKTNALQRRKS